MQEEKIKLAIKRRVPLVVPVLRPIYTGTSRALAGVGAAQQLHRRLRPRRQVFEGLVGDRVWEAEGTVCGSNSTAASTVRLRESLQSAIQRLGVRSMVDAPCGDWSWMHHVDLGGIDYTGVDIVKALIESDRERFGGPGRTFRVGDIVTDELPRADLIFCRDCFIHLSFDDALAALANFVRSGSTYLATTHYAAQEGNAAIFTGQWRTVNLEAAPFRLPPPCDRIEEDDTRGVGKAMGVWRLEEVGRALARRRG